MQQTLDLIQSTPNEKEYEAGTKKLENDMENMLKKKDKLLEMRIEELITKAEFKVRNDTLNGQVVLLERKIRRVEEEQSKSRRVADKLPAIKAALEEALSFADEINTELVSRVLEKLVVHSTGDRGRACVDVHLKTGEIL